ncbi:MAG: hypothetical protein ABII01_05945 [Candidatus Woesearchaeota archaeon]
MELISRVSKGSRMDQIYIPKIRAGFSIGSFVMIKPLHSEEARKTSLFFHNVHSLEPVKTRIINEIFEILDNQADTVDNIIITGSFLEKGFNFNDIDVLLIKEEKIDKTQIERYVKEKTGLDIHLISISNKSLIKGLESDPLYQGMLNRCIAKKRFVYMAKRKINYRILDLHLLKSRLFIDNFDYLNGEEKYEMIRNAVSIDLFMNNMKISTKEINKTIDRIFGENMNKKIRLNMIPDKQKFLIKFREYHHKLSDEILKGIKNGSKQE